MAKLRIFLGFLLLFIGGVGIFLPLLPTTPFVLLAMICFAREPHLQAYVRRLPMFREYIEDYQSGCGISGRVLSRSLLILWGMLGLSAYLAGNPWLGILLAAVGVGVSWHLVHLRLKGLRNRQFSMVELLVVISIISILAGLLLPVLGKARAKMDRTTCINNLKQIGQGLDFYTSDHADMIPGVDDTYWGSSVPIVRTYGGTVLALGKLIGLYRLPADVFGCPANKTRLPSYVRTTWDGSSPVVQTAYLYRETDVDFLPKKSHPGNAGRALVMDFACLYATGTIEPHQFQDVNLLYNDGHVETRSNSPAPGVLYTLAAAAGPAIPPCESAWLNSDK